MSKIWKVVRNKDFLAVIFLVFLTIVFFWKFFFKGLVPIPADITVGMYYPWLDFKWGYAVGVPVKNSILSDVVSMIYPIKMYAIDLIKSGQWPLWNPFMFAGYPLLANFQSAVFSITNILYFILPKVTAWSFQIILQPFLAALFTFLLLRHFGLGRLSALVGGLAYGFSGFNIIQLEWNAHSLVAAFIPLIILLTDKFLLEKKLVWGLILSFAVAFQIFAGYPQLVLYTMLVVFVFLGFRKKELTVKNFLALLFFLTAGFLLAAIQLFPGFELFLSAQRIKEVIPQDLRFLPWQNAITFLAPDYFGNHVTGNFWGAGNYTNNTVGYTGLVTFVLATVGLSFIRKSREVQFFALVLIIALLFSFPTPIAKIIVEHVFGMKASSATRILVLFNLSLAALGAFGFEKLSQKWDLKIVRAAYLPWIALLGTFVGTFFSYKQLSEFQSHLVDSGAVFKTFNAFFPSVTDLYVASRNLAFPIALLAILSIILFLGRIKALKTICLLAILILAIGELFRFGWKYTSFNPQNLLFPTTPIISFLQSQGSSYRINTGDVIPMNMWMPYGLESASGYDAIYPSRSAKFLAVTNSDDPNAIPMTRYGAIDRYQSKLFDLTGTKFVLALKRDKIAKPNPEGKPLFYFNLPKFKEIFMNGTVVVLENKNVLPRAFLVGDYKIEKGENVIFTKLLNSSFDLSKTIILEENPELKIGPMSKGDEVYKDKSGTITTSSKNNMLLFVSDSYYPGWRAKIDGQISKVYRADYAFRAVAVPSGKHQIEFFYDSISFKIGFIVSLATTVFLAGLFWIDKYWRKWIYN